VAVSPPVSGPPPADASGGSNGAVRLALPVCRRASRSTACRWCF